MRKLFLSGCFVTVLFASCKKDEAKEMNVQGPDQVVYAINSNNELVQFNAKSPSVSIAKMAVTGIVSGEKLLSIDFRPATGELYALSNASKLYIINQQTASARVVGTAAFSPAIMGTASIDFNPTVDRIRLVTSAAQNLRLNPETGTVAATDAAINGGSSPMITGVAYTNSKAAASTTVLYDVDITAGKLYKQDPPNNGTLVEVGSLGITATGVAAFDITGESTALLAAGMNLYLVDLATGKAGKIGATAETFIDIAIPTAPVAYATDAANNLQIFNPQNITAGIVTKAITGLQAGENILGIDFRPLNGQLYALGSTSRLYTLNLSSGVATAVGTGAFLTPLSGTDFGFDFNPTVDRIRVVSNTGQNLRLNPNDGTVAAVDLPLNPGSPAVSAAAYTNNFSGATTTTLFVIDHATDKLYVQNPPNNGTLVEVGNLGTDITNANGFDIGSRSNMAYLVATSASGTSLYTVNTTSGMLSNALSFPSPVKGFAIGTGF